MTDFTAEALSGEANFAKVEISPSGFNYCKMTRLCGFFEA
jgi:hypothetical protein